MGKITIVLSDDTENRLRAHLRKRGDLSRIIETALEEWLDRTDAAASSRLTDHEKQREA